jgi:transposase
MERTKARRARYRLECKPEAVRRVQSGQSLAAAARTLGVVEPTLDHGVQGARAGRRKGADRRSKVSAEPREISRLRSAWARVQRERDLRGKATAYFAKGLQCSTPLFNRTGAWGPFVGRAAGGGGGWRVILSPWFVAL